MKNSNDRCRAHWTINALLSFLFIGIGQYCLGKSSVNVWGGILMMSLGFLIFGIILVIGFWVYWSVVAKRCLGILESSLVKKNEKTEKFSIAPGIIMSFCTGSL